MADVTVKEQKDSSSDAILQQAKEQLAKKADSESLLNSSASSTTNSSQLAQVLALLGSLDVTGDESFAKAIIDFPLEGSNFTETGFSSRIDSMVKNPEEARNCLKELGEAMLTNPPPELANFVKNGQLCMPKILEHGTAMIQNASKELEQLFEEVKKEEAKKEGGEKLAEEVKKSTQEAVKEPVEEVEKEETQNSNATTSSQATQSSKPQETSDTLGFSFEANDSYAFMTNVLADMSNKVNEIQAKISENSAKTADWDYTLSQAFITEATDALNKAIKDKKDYEKKLHKQKKLNSWLKPLMIVVMVVTTILLCVAGQPWLALLMLGLMTMQMSGGTEKTLNALTEGLHHAGMSRNDAKIMADAIYIAVVVIMAIAAPEAAGAMLGAESGVAASMTLGLSGSVMVATTALSTTTFFDDLATIIIQKYGTNENETRLALMCAGLAFCLVTNIGAGYYSAASSGSKVLELMGDWGTRVMFAGAAIDIGAAAAMTVVQIMLGLNKLDLADSEESVTLSSAWVSYFNELSAQTTQISENIIESNNASISALGESLSAALNSYAGAGENLAQHMA